MCVVFVDFGKLIFKLNINCEKKDYSIPAPYRSRQIVQMLQL